jgi:hypothetical protein
MADDLSGKFLRFFRVKPYSLEIRLSRPEKARAAEYPHGQQPQETRPCVGARNGM